MKGIHAVALAMIACVGIGGAYFVSSELRTQARENWEQEAANTANALSGTLLGWMEESYAPLSGLAALAANSDNLTEAEFLNAYDGLEARTTSLFLEGTALVVPGLGPTEWRIAYSSNLDGPLGSDEPIANRPEMLEALGVAHDRFGEIILGRPLVDGRGNQTALSPVVLATYNPVGTSMIVGLVDHRAMVESLAQLHLPDGVSLHLKARFAEPGGPGLWRDVLSLAAASDIYDVPVRTVTAGAELLATWGFSARFSGGVDAGLANAILVSGVGATLFIVLLVGFLLSQNRIITQKVERATAELSAKTSLLEAVLRSIKQGLVAYNKDLMLIVSNDRFRQIRDVPKQFTQPGASFVDWMRFDAGRGEFGDGDPEREMLKQVERAKEFTSHSFERARPDGSVIEVEGGPLPGGGFVSTYSDITERKLAEQRVRESEQKVRRIFETANEGIIVLDNDWVAVELNAAMSRILGRAIQDVVGMSAFDLVDEENGRILGEQMKRRKQGESGAYEVALSRPDGTQVPCLINATPLMDDVGTKVGSFAMITDFTDRKEFERQIIENEQQIRRLFETSNEGIWVIDNDAATTEINDSLSQILGRRSEEVVGKYLYEFLDEASKLVFYEQLEKRRKGLSTSYEVTIERPDGSGVPVVINGTPMYDAAGVKTGSFGMVTDITEVKHKEAQLKDAYAVISESIDYAANIQRSVLPDERAFESLFDDYFVIWEPRDRIGGDVYWNRDWGHGHLVMLADCTGHGVPGAFVTLIATGALDRALEKVEPGRVDILLQRIHQFVQLTLGQHKAEGSSDDGLELGACYLPGNHAAMVFAGARFSLFQDDGGDVQEIRGDKKGIGYRGIDFDQKYTRHAVDLRLGRRFYLTTDGLIDQIGGERRRGFGKKRFKDLIRSTRGSPFPEQRSAILGALEAYQGQERRRDDISLIGFQVKDASSSSYQGMGI